MIRQRKKMYGRRRSEPSLNKHIDHDT